MLRKRQITNTEGGILLTIEEYVKTNDGTQYLVIEDMETASGSRFCIQIRNGSYTLRDVNFDFTAPPLFRTHNLERLKLCEGLFWLDENPELEKMINRSLSYQDASGFFPSEVESETDPASLSKFP